MVKQAEPASQAMNGTDNQQSLAASMLDLFRAHGRFMAADKAIRLTATSLADALGRAHDGVSTEQIAEAARLNPGAFSVEETDEGVIVSSTRFGKAPVSRSVDARHDFAARMMTPVPRLAAQLKGEVIRLDSAWSEVAASVGESALYDADRPLPAAIIVDRPMLPPTRLEDEREPEVAEEEISATEEPTPITESVYAWDRPFTRPVPQEEPTPEPATEPEAEESITPATDDLARLIIEEPIGDFAEIADEAAAEPAAAEASTDAEVAEPEPVAVPAPVEVPPAPEPRRAPALRVSDFSGVDDAALAAAISQRLGADQRFASFNEQWMTEDRVPRLSRGDLRRIKEYIQEQEQPLTDEVLVQDVLGGRPNSPDFDLLRFAINFRLSREHRDYDFVGTNDQRFWSTSTMPQIGTTRRKPNEIGTDYRYLLDETPETVEHRSIDTVLHVVTFFEYYHGLLPYDAEMQALLPAPMEADQRTAMLTFETPQSYTTFLVELRYPTPNRGGFILGLDDFFNENLVPGALIQIQRTDNDGHYRVEFLPADSRTGRLLELDERRSQRYVFHDIEFSCEVEDAMLLTEDRFGALANDKPVDEKVRRRPESVVAAVFERLGNKSGPGFTSTFEDLYAAVNVERPMSETLLRRVLDTDETGAFAKDPDASDAYSYVPPRS